MVDNRKPVFKENVIYIENEDISPQGTLNFSTNGKPVLIFIHANFCPQCDKVKQIFQNFADGNPDIQCAVILIDGNSSEKMLGKRMDKIIPKIIGVPTIVQCLNGKYSKTFDIMGGFQYLSAFAYSQ